MNDNTNQEFFKALSKLYQQPSRTMREIIDEDNLKKEMNKYIPRVKNNK